MGMVPSKQLISVISKVIIRQRSIDNKVIIRKLFYIISYYKTEEKGDLQLM